MFGLGLPEATIILMVMVLLLFGKEKISDLAKGVGRVMGEYKKGRAEIEEEIKGAEREVNEEDIEIVDEEEKSDKKIKLSSKKKIKSK